MEKQYYKIELSLEAPQSLTENQIDNFFEEVIELVEKYKMTAGGGIKPVDEQGNAL